MTLKLDKDNPLATKVQTRDGRRAVLYDMDFNGRLAGKVETVPGEWQFFGWAQDGRYFNSSLDLINVPVPSVEHRVWVNIVCGRSLPRVHDTYATKEAADEFAETRGIHSRIACVEVVFKEGDGLS